MVLHVFWWTNYYTTCVILVWFKIYLQAMGMDPYKPREEWHPYDPYLISEGLFGAGMISSFLKLVHIFSINPHLGNNPLFNWYYLNFSRSITPVLLYFGCPCPVQWSYFAPIYQRLLLGPLQISLGRMVVDILKWALLYTLVLFAFGCGMNQLLWYYADLEYDKCYSLPGITETVNGYQWKQEGRREGGGAKALPKSDH